MNADIVKAKRLVCCLNLVALAMALTIHGFPPSNVFRLYGGDENSASFALGWVFWRKARHIAKSSLKRCSRKRWTSIMLLSHYSGMSEDGGYTDLEIQAGHHFHAWNS